MRSDPKAETRAMHACDALFGKIMHAGTESCERCGRPGVQVAHIQRRRYWLLRCDETNVRMLCPDLCHRAVDAGEWNWVELIGLPEWTRLFDLARNEGKKPHDWWRSELARLRVLARSVGVTP